jgi:mRNA-degrading endonuclease RelE of RelBE toxin-antitoxin system
MIYNIIYTPRFKKDLKFYRKRYRSTDQDISEILEELENGNLIGEDYDNLHLPESESVYKVKIAIKSIPVGISGGYRLIYYVVKNECEIYLLTLYYKGDRQNVSQVEILNLIKQYCI